MLAFTTTTHFHHSFWLLSSFENFNHHGVAQTCPAQRPSKSCAVCRHSTGCTAVMQAESTLPVLHPCSCLFSFLFKKEKKNLNLWTAASIESLPWRLSSMKSKQKEIFLKLCLLFFFPHGNGNIIHTKRAFYI